MAFIMIVLLGQQKFYSLFYSPNSDQAFDLQTWTFINVI